jgi:hypothetical protein
MVCGLARGGVVPFHSIILASGHEPTGLTHPVSPVLAHELHLTAEAAPLLRLNQRHPDCLPNSIHLTERGDSVKLHHIRSLRRWTLSPLPSRLCCDNPSLGAQVRMESPSAPDGSSQPHHGRSKLQFLSPLGEGRFHSPVSSSPRISRSSPPPSRTLGDVA